MKMEREFPYAQGRGPRAEGGECRVGWWIEQSEVKLKGLGSGGV